jgi:hypothetical protein
MVELNTKLVKEVNAFLKGADRSFIATLSGLERDDIMGHATVRYLMRKGHWPFTPNSEFAEVMDHFFATYPEKKAVDPVEYQSTTFDIIKAAWDYECVPIVIEPTPASEKKPNPGKRSKKPRMEPDPDYNQEGESGSRTFKSLEDHDIDTKGASERLKKTIAIQRGS